MCLAREQVRQTHGSAAMRASEDVPAMGERIPCRLTIIVESSS
jgi:hypothetical protein